MPYPGRWRLSRLIRCTSVSACDSSPRTAPCCAGNRTWPTYRHDNRRSGVTPESLAFPLVRQWVWKSPQPPQTAWSGPAKWDAYSGNSGLQSMRNFDPCFYVTSDGERVLFGSSADDAVHAIDAATGK